MLISYGATADIYHTVNEQKKWYDQLIERAEHIEGYILAITFKNGKQKVINIKPYIRRHPKIFQEMIDDPQIVSQVKSDSCEIFWNDLMGINAHTLYNMKTITE